MWNYEKRLQYPVNIKNPDGRIAQIIMSQYGGPDGEIGASLRYLSQRFTMPNRKIMGILNDIGISVTIWYPLQSTPQKYNFIDLAIYDKINRGDIF